MASFFKSALVGLLVASAAAAPAQIRPPTVQRRSSSSKRGAAYNDASLVSILAGSSETISWAYNWGSESDGTIPSGVEYIPMLWGTDSIDGWTSAVKTALSDGSMHIMGFNEPDSSSQANMSPSDAATYYKEYITPYADEATLISPAVTSSESSGEGLDWMESFLEDCTDCEVSALAVHWYGSSFSELKSFVTEAISTASTYGISEVWLTEFGLSSDESGILDLVTAAAFVLEASVWLEAQSEVTRYAYFYCANDFMLTDNVVNAVGDAYVAASGASATSTTSSTTIAATTTSYSSSSTSWESTIAFSTSTSESTVVPTPIPTPVSSIEPTSEPVPEPTTSATPSVAPAATTSTVPVYSVATSTSVPAMSPSPSPSPISSPSPSSYTLTPSTSTYVAPTTAPIPDDSWENGACSQVVKQIIVTRVVPV
ncbi:hypothetical protein N7478_009276 [Penicillium angulare]|uniref:uncharacterized protein n=1 Tax=Penicillium angulare TaxID=116970 RepID=UPI00253FC47B|nr:uncharacterized protein N7478_009276 [Penicillium angulare]KAJ5266468.1 hypothetical protein N7478_009276 [Penicillium angulare]